MIENKRIIKHLLGKLQALSNFTQGLTEPVEIQRLRHCQIISVQCRIESLSRLAGGG
jgi:hypothetical protein